VPKSKDNIYGGRDPRDIPTYPLPEAARILRLPESTLRKWVHGQVYSTKAGSRRSRPIVAVSGGRPWTLSFWNLAEAHILAAITRQHGVALQSARKALDYVASKLDRPRPLITQDFHTDGVNLFVERLEQLADDDPGVRSLVNASRQGQLAARDLLKGVLKRVSRDTGGLIERIYPWIKTLDEPRRIEIDPRRAFGRPVVTGTRVPADELAERFAAGDGVEEIAHEFRMDPSLVEGVLQWEMARTQDASAA
jgi:uncharacterized protein (DUF433 family)